MREPMVASKNATRQKSRPAFHATSYERSSQAHTRIIPPFPLNAAGFVSLRRMALMPLFPISSVCP
jgi:hypothetical protein